MKPKLTIPQCQEILRRAESEQGAKIFGEIAESISGLLDEKDKSRLDWLLSNSHIKVGEIYLTSRESLDEAMKHNP